MESPMRSTNVPHSGLGIILFQCPYFQRREYRLLLRPAAMLAVERSGTVRAAQAHDRLLPPRMTRDPGGEVIDSSVDGRPAVRSAGMLRDIGQRIRSLVARRLLLLHLLDKLLFVLLLVLPVGKSADRADDDTTDKHGDELVVHGR